MVNPGMVKMNCKGLPVTSARFFFQMVSISLSYTGTRRAAKQKLSSLAAEAVYLKRSDDDVDDIFEDAGTASSTTD